jgi:hypothetical protein
VVWARAPAALCLLLMAACARERPGDPQHTPATSPLPATPARAALIPVLPQLPPLSRERLSYMFAAAELVQRSWPLMVPERTCVLLIEIERQWVVNCDDRPRGFTPTPELFRARPVSVHEGGSFASGGQQRSTAELLRTTPAAAHVQASGDTGDGSGLPGADPWLVIGSLEALAQFHPAFPEATTEAWVSVAMHELLHIHQLRAPQFAAYLPALARGQRTSAALDELYASSPGYRARVAREYALLMTAAEAPASDGSAALRALRSWRALYRERIRSISARSDKATLIEDDALFTYLEGVARYVESDFLDNRAQHPATLPHDDPRFHRFDQFLDRGYRASPNRQLDTQYVYAIGYHLCVLLDRIDKNWQKSVHTRSQWLYSEVETLAAKGGGG